MALCTEHAGRIFPAFFYAEAAKQSSLNSGALAPEFIISNIIAVNK